MSRSLPALAAILIAASVAARAQECVAGLPEAGAGWARVPISEHGGDAPMARKAHVVCRDCRPEVALVLSSGPAAPALTDTSVGRLAGLDWARAVFENEALRNALLRSVVDSERRSSPGCTLDGHANGVAEVGGLGMFGTAIRADCAGEPGHLAAEYFSGYDGRCLYQAKVVWAGREAPDAATRDRIAQILRIVQWKR